MPADEFLPGTLQRSPRAIGKQGWGQIDGR